MEKSYTEILNTLHSCHLLMAKEVKRICEKYDIKYYIIAGTLLGAVRHKSAIPWDDDMDIGMFRDDYERFLELCKTELSDTMFVEDFSTDKHYALPFAKIMLKDTVMVERSTKDNPTPKSVYVDIFPFDNVPDSDSLRSKQNRKTYFLKRLLLAKLGYKVYGEKDFVKRLVYTVLRFIATFRNAESIHQTLYNSMTEYNTIDTKKVTNIGGAYGYYKEMLDKEWFKNSAELPFSDITLSAPGEYISYLEYFYGDYMKLPPEDKRGNRHSIVEFDFGKYGG